MRRLSLKLAMSATAVVMVAAVAYVAWSQASQNAAVESKVLAEARTLNVEMRAVWNYIDDSQQAINVNSDGTYDFKGIYCSMAGKAIAQRFTRESDGYVIRYVRENPRTATDEPDDFEKSALGRFAEGDATEHFQMDANGERPVFRYASVLPIKRNCLVCHGEPAGTPDETGFLREGMELGDVAGAVSITIPLGAYVQEARADLVGSVAFFCLLAAAIALLLALAIRRWVAVPLELVNRRLESENEEKSNFLAIMSHELRTPLSSIIAFTDIWEKSARMKDPEEERLVREIKDNSVTLLNMVNNTIDVARLEAGRLEVQIDDVDLVDVVNAVFAVAEPLAIKQGIALSKSVDKDIPIMRSDWEALRKIILNLVSNALKFTSEGGSVSVDARLADDGKTVRIRVSDTGIGIAAADHARVFSKFTQSSSAGASDSGGSGLGLFLVRSLAEKLGGSVVVDSEPGCGSVFDVVVPATSVKMGEGE